MIEKETHKKLKEKNEALEKELSALKRQVEEVYVPLTEVTNEALFIVDSECRYLFITNNMSLYLGIPVNGVVGKKYGDFHNAEATRIFGERVAEVFASGLALQDEHISRHGDKHILRTFFPIKAPMPDGKVVKIAVIAHDITKRRQSEDALKESEERYRDLVENSNDFICTHDMEGKLLSVNWAAEKFIGYNRDALIGRNLREFLDPQVKEEFSSYLSTIRKEGAAQGLMTVITSAGVKRVWAYNNNLRTDGVASPFVRGIAHDVTERVLAERKLGKTLSLLHATLESAAAGILAVDVTGNILTWNTKFTEMWKIPEDVINARDTDRVLAIACSQFDDSEGFLAKRRKILKEPNVEFTDKLHLTDGRIFERTSRPQMDKDKIVGRVYSFHDITNHRKMEEELRKSEERYRTIIENIDDGYFEVDLYGNFTFINKAGARIFGYSQDEITQIFGKKFVHSEDIVKIRQVLKDFLATGQMPASIEWRIVRKDENVRFVESSLSIISDARGKALGFRGIIRDISEKKQTEETIRQIAYHDFLTGLPNRVLLNDRLNVALMQLKRHQEKLALMVIDLDRFKEINDTMGHITGDLLLQKVGKRLSELIRESDTAARIGGDEFMLLLPNIAGEQDAVVIARKILDAFQEPFECEEYKIHITPSIGIAICPDHGLDTLTVMKHADYALYLVKERGRNNYHLWSAH